MGKIETLHPKIPWSWVPVICLPWVTTNYVGQCSDMLLTFTIRKFEHVEKQAREHGGSKRLCGLSPQKL